MTAKGKDVDSGSGARRHWTIAEERAFMAALKDLVVAGQRSGNGFKPGHLTTLEKALVAALPGTTLRAKPHIDSKVHVWRKQFNALFTMVGKSGQNWSPESFMFDVTEEAWNEAIKKEPSLKKRKNRPIPEFGEWLEIFGRDRADEEFAENCHEAYHDQFRAAPGKPTESGVDGGSSENHREEGEGDRSSGIGLNPEASNGNLANRPSCGGSRRRSCSEMDGRFMDLMHDMAERADARIAKIARQMGYGYDVSTARTKVFEALGVFSDLTLEQRVAVGKRFANSPPDLDFFFSLPEDARLEMVKQSLRHNPF